MIETFFELPCPAFTALLTDSHNTEPSPILDSLRNRRPDIITVAGDFLFGERGKKSGHKMEESRPAVELLRGCAGIAPTFVSLGNHEWMVSDEDIRTITKTGVTLLENSWTLYKGMVIGGLSSAYYTDYRAYRKKHPDITTDPKFIKTVIPYTPIPELSWLDQFENQPGFRILLCHHPEYYPKYLSNRNIDLVFSGHCHGGQWRYYSVLRKEEQGVYAPGQGLFPRLTSGVHNGHLVISRGLSNTTIIPRLNNPPEIIYIRPKES